MFSCRYVNLEAHNKNALVSLSLTDEPIVVDVIRHSNQDKVKKVSSCKCGIIRLHKCWCG